MLSLLPAAGSVAHGHERIREPNDVAVSQEPEDQTADREGGWHFRKSQYACVAAAQNIFIRQDKYDKKNNCMKVNNDF